MEQVLLVIIVFVALPTYILLYIWKKTNWKWRKKWLGTAIVSVVFLFIINSGEFVDFSRDNAIDVEPAKHINPENSNIIETDDDYVDVSIENTDDDEFVIVNKVIDGDTIELDDGRRVRYIGINTPEMEHNGQEKECLANEATNENKKMVLGKEVILEKDVSETDKYGRLLRYVYVGPILINEYLIDKGLAKTVYIKPDISYYEEFKMVEDEARKEKRGMWADGACD